MKLTTRQITVTGIMLALCIISQFFKNTSVFITGPIINCILIITTLYCGLLCGTLLSIITPITSFFITGSPIMSALPIIIPCVIIGNILLILGIAFSKKFISRYLTLSVGVLIGSLLKYAFMTLAIAKYILPVMGADKLKAPIIAIASTTFSTTQLITALIGGAIACIIWPVLKVAFKKEIE